MSEQSATSPLPAMHLANAIRVQRDRAGLSQQEAAHRCQMSLGHFRSLETGRYTNPTVGTLLALSSGLNCSITRFVFATCRAQAQPAGLQPKWWRYPDPEDVAEPRDAEGAAAYALCWAHGEHPKHLDEYRPLVRLVLETHARLAAHEKKQEAR